MCGNQSCGSGVWRAGSGVLTRGAFHIWQKQNAAEIAVVGSSATDVSLLIFCFRVCVRLFLSVCVTGETRLICCCYLCCLAQGLVVSFVCVCSRRSCTSTTTHIDTGMDSGGFAVAAASANEANNVVSLLGAENYGMLSLCFLRIAHTITGVL